jgi:pyrroline-5-carboxylate reductase
MERLAALTGKGHTVICTAAGVSLERLRSALGSGPSLYRIMPNLAIALGEGAVALAPEEGTPPEQAELVKNLFEGLGTVERVPEGLINAFTSISGAGPAFLALAMEGLEDGAVRSGVPRPIARRVLKQMMMGTAGLFMEGDLTFTELKERVASPGGTTIAGLAILEERGVRGAMLRAIEASTQRGAEL